MPSYDCKIDSSNIYQCVHCNNLAHHVCFLYFIDNMDELKEQADGAPIHATHVCTTKRNSKWSVLLKIDVWADEIYFAPVDVYWVGNSFFHA